MEQEAISRSRRNEFNWGPGLFLIGYHLLLVICLPIYFYYFSAPKSLLIASAILMYVTGLSVTMGYHRLYAHTTYKLNPVVEAILLFFATMATQGSALRWSFDHRLHHAFVDTDKDPYSIKKGFWYAHFMWLFEKPVPIDNKVVANLVKNPLLRFQHKYYGILMVLTNALAVGVLGWVYNDFLAAVLFGWLARTFVLHHLTWFINSLAHTWGARTFCKELSAVDNYIIALLTFGEGYHNYHHTFAYDYRNGIRWFHFDPTKWLIWTLSKCGFATQLRVVQNYQIQEKILVEHKHILLHKIEESFPNQKEEWETKLTNVINEILIPLRQLRKLQEEYLSFKKEGEKDRLHDLKLEIKKIRKAFKEEYRKWVELRHNLQEMTS